MTSRLSEGCSVGKREKAKTASMRRNEPRGAKDAAVARLIAATQESEVRSKKRSQETDESGSDQEEESATPSTKRTKRASAATTDRDAPPAPAKTPMPAKGKKKRVRTEEDDDDADDEREGDQPRKRTSRAKGAITPTDEPPAEAEEKRTNYTEAEDALLKEVWKEMIEEKGMTQAGAVKEYQERAKRQGLPYRSQASFQRRSKRLSGHSATYFWNAEQIMFVDELKKKRLSRKGAHEEWEAERARRGWSYRSPKSLSEKMRTLTDREVEEATAEVNDRAASTASRATGRKFEWEPEEDALILKMLRNGADIKRARKCRESMLADDFKGPKVDRTELAIQRRYRRLKRKDVRTVRQSRNWTKRDDIYLEKEMKTAGGDAAKEEETMKVVAKRLDVRPHYVRRRWTWIKSWATGMDVRPGGVGQKRLSLEERQLRAGLTVSGAKKIRAADDVDLVTEAGGVPSCPPTPREVDTPASKSIYHDSTLWDALNRAVERATEAPASPARSEDADGVAAVLEKDPGQLFIDQLGDAPLGREEVLAAYVAASEASVNAGIAEEATVVAASQKDVQASEEPMSSTDVTVAEVPAEDENRKDVQPREDDNDYGVGSDNNGTGDAAVAVESVREGRTSTSGSGPRISVVADREDTQASRTGPIQVAAVGLRDEPTKAAVCDEANQDAGESFAGTTLEGSAQRGNAGGGSSPRGEESSDSEAEGHTPRDEDSSGPANDTAVDDSGWSAGAGGQPDRSPTEESEDKGRHGDEPEVNKSVATEPDELNEDEAERDTLWIEDDAELSNHEAPLSGTEDYPVDLSSETESGPESVPDDDEGQRSEVSDEYSMRSDVADDYDDNGELDQWKRQMKPYLLTFLGDRGVLEEAQPYNLGRYQEYIPAKSRAGKDLQQMRAYEARCKQESANNFVMERPCGSGPRLSKGRVRLLMFAISLLQPTPEMTEMFLRELWAGPYGECRSGACGLKYDWSHPKFDHLGGCRHWHYYYHREVYFDSFEDEGDYRLAAALAIHLEAREATCGQKWEEPRGGWNEYEVDVRAYCPLVKVFKEWPEQVRFVHALCAFGWMSSLRLGEDFMESTEDRSQWCHGSYGKLRFGEEDARGYPAMLLKIAHVWFFVCKVSPMTIRDNLREIRWRPMADVKQLLDRFCAVDQYHEEPSPIISKLAARDYQLESRNKPTLRGDAWSLYTQFKSFLNADQARVMDTMLENKGVIMNRGPYGCGKTTVIASCAVMYIRAYPGERVLIVSETNAAIDEDLERIIKMGVIEEAEILRVGRLSERMEAYRKYYYSARIEDRRQQLEMQGASKKRINDELTGMKTRMVARARIIVATLGQMPKQWMQDEEFHLIINDEGGQTLETSLLQAIRPAVHTLMVVGDERQLRGYTCLPERTRDFFVYGSRPHKITWSVLHAMIDQAQDEATREGRNYHDDVDFPGITVHTEFRSNRRITKLLEVFYDYPLDCRARESSAYLRDMELPATNGERLGDERVAWYGTEEADVVRPEVQNFPELLMGVELLLRIKAELKRKGVTVKKTVFLITPYARQVALFKRVVEDLDYMWSNYLTVDVMTTDSSQGREAEIVIASMVRQTWMGFLSEYPARSLVTLSRVRDYLFILAKWRPFRNDKMWRKLKERASEMGIPYRSVDWTSQFARDRLRDAGYLKTLGLVGTRDGE